MASGVSVLCGRMRSVFEFSYTQIIGRDCGHVVDDAARVAVVCCIIVCMRAWLRIFGLLLYCCGGAL